MIKYTLKCSDNHTFDSWFDSASVFDKLMNAGLVTCAVCGTIGVEKAIMAPQVQNSRKKAKPPSLSEPASPAEQAVTELRKLVEEKSEDVGTDFAKQARAMHDGDAPERSIFGQAKPEEAKALIEDGVPVIPLPWTNKKTN
jgi:hypothetical protein